MTLLVKDYLGKRGKKGDIGIEIEVEADLPLPQINTEHWKTQAEGSIRDGVEYVTTGPLTLVDKTRAIKYLASKLDTKALKIKEDSPRTSVHVHKNILYHTPIEYWTTACAYWLTEELLFDFCGDYRKGNLFCLRLSDAEGVIKYCINDLKKDLPFHSFNNNDCIRYAGQNLAATAKFGSLEYRGMRFTLDPDRLDKWTSEINTLHTKSKEYHSPATLMDAFFKNDKKKDFLETLYSPEFVYDLTKVKGWEEKLERNEGILCELAYYHDWTAWQSKIEKYRNSITDEQSKIKTGPNDQFTIRYNEIAATIQNTTAPLAMPEAGR